MASPPAPLLEDAPPEALFANMYSVLFAVVCNMLRCRACQRALGTSKGDDAFGNASAAKLQHIRMYHPGLLSQSHRLKYAADWSKSCAVMRTRAIAMAPSPSPRGLTKDMLADGLARLTLMDLQPLSSCEGGGMRALAASMGTSETVSRRTVTRRVERFHRGAVQWIAARVRAAREAGHSVCVMHDGWTDPTGRGVLAIMLRFVDVSGTLCEIPIAFVGIMVSQRESGDFIADAIAAAIKVVGLLPADVDLAISDRAAAAQAGSRKFLAMGGVRETVQQGCATHDFNNVMKAVEGDPVVKSCLDDVRTLVARVRDNRRLWDHVGKPPMPCPTRFYTNAPPLAWVVAHRDAILGIPTNEVKPVKAAHEAMSVHLDNDDAFADIALASRLFDTLADASQSLSSQEVLCLGKTVHDLHTMRILITGTYHEAAAGPITKGACEAMLRDGWGVEPGGSAAAGVKKIRLAATVSASRKGAGVLDPRVHHRLVGKGDYIKEGKACILELAASRVAAAPAPDIAVDELLAEAGIESAPAVAAASPIEDELKQVLRTRLKEGTPDSVVLNMYFKTGYIIPREYYEPDYAPKTADGKEAIIALDLTGLRWVAAYLFSDPGHTCSLERALSTVGQVWDSTTARFTAEHAAMISLLHIMATDEDFKREVLMVPSSSHSVGGSSSAGDDSDSDGGGDGDVAMSDGIDAAGAAAEAEVVAGAEGGSCRRGRWRPCWACWARKPRRGEWPQAAAGGGGGG